MYMSVLSRHSIFSRYIPPRSFSFYLVLFQKMKQNEKNKNKAKAIKKIKNKINKMNKIKKQKTKKDKYKMK